MPTHTPDSAVPDQGRVMLFQEQALRRSWHENEWWFSVVDVCPELTGSVDALACWRKLKQRLVAERGEPVTSSRRLKLAAMDGRQRVTANTEGLAGNARRKVEAKSGTPVLSKKNYLALRGTAPAVEAPPVRAIRGKALRKGKKA